MSSVRSVHSGKLGRQEGGTEDERYDDIDHDHDNDDEEDDDDNDENENDIFVLDITKLG